MLKCPDTALVTESAALVPGWQSSVSEMSRKFARIEIANRDDKDRDYQLAPDDEKQTGKDVVQTWNLTSYRSMKLFLSCFYQDTRVVLSSEIPPGVQTCTFRFSYDSRNKALLDPKMDCH